MVFKAILRYFGKFAYLFLDVKREDEGHSHVCTINIKGFGCMSSPWLPLSVCFSIVYY